ncbi:hypothetical protein KW850_28720 [Bacillus sp. sid0103]|uniref:hypothetical protein n=1 Tax=Bacillus sp. sid0103 TaxID=2856337 RepID=UPI001C44AF20|nr:hypothetical protein [Bacillus sp. sid0103]
MLSVDGKRIEVYQKVTKIFGYLQEDLQDKYFKAIIVPIQIEEVRYYFNQFIISTFSNLSFVIA